MLILSSRGGPEATRTACWYNDQGPMNGGGSNMRRMVVLLSLLLGSAALCGCAGGDSGVDVVDPFEERQIPADIAPSPITHTTIFSGLESLMPKAVGMPVPNPPAMPR